MRNCSTVVWVRIGNIGKQALLHWIEPMLPFIFRDIEAGEKLIELSSSGKR